MGHARRQLADRGKFLGLVEHLLAFFELGSLLADPFFQFFRQRFVTGFGLHQAGMLAAQRFEVFGHRFEMQAGGHLEADLRAQQRQQQIASRSQGRRVGRAAEQIGNRLQFKDQRFPPGFRSRQSPENRSHLIGNGQIAPEQGGQGRAYFFNQRRIEQIVQPPLTVEARAHGCAPSAPATKASSSSP